MTEDEDTPFWRTIADVPDDRFPLGIRPGYALVTFADRGHQVRVLCCVCRREVRMSARDICLRFPEWLPCDRHAWASALRCSGCGAKRLSIQVLNDPAAIGFGNAISDDWQAIRMRRLLAYLGEAGVALADVADQLVDMECDVLEAAGFPPEIYSLFKPSRRNLTL